MEWMIETPSVKVGRWRDHGPDAPSLEGGPPWPRISLIHDGAYRVSTEGRSYVADTVTAVLLSPAQRYTISPLVAGATRGSTVAVHPAVLGVVFGRPELRGRFPCPIAPLTPRAVLIERCLLRAATLSQPNPMPLEEAVLDFIRELVGPLLLDGVDGAGRRRGRRQRQGLVDAVRTRLAGSPASPVRLGQIADWVGCSPYHLSRVFRAETGQPVHRYVTRLRLVASLERLPECDDLSTLARDLGFSSHSHFTSAFRSEFGLTPSAFRRCPRTKTASFPWA
jgi:AraC-like DNA-binding protein